MTEGDFLMIPLTIYSYGYNPQTKILTASFGMPTSCVYSFEEVPPEIVEKLRNAENLEELRTVFNDTVRGIYRSKRIL
jgi:hypothetical protein